MAKAKLTREEIKRRLADVRLFSLDVDGVLTDGSLYYDDNGDRLRKFNVKDGMGIKRAMQAGIEVAIVTASTTPSILHRARVLGIRHVAVGVEDKLPRVAALAASLGFTLAEVAHIGDDVNDLEVLNAVGCPLTVADGVTEVREAALYVTERRGGDGAVREICDMIVATRQSGS